MSFLDLSGLEAALATDRNGNNGNNGSRERSSWSAVGSLNNNRGNGNKNNNQNQNNGNGMKFSNGGFTAKSFNFKSGNPLENNGKKDNRNADKTQTRIQMDVARMEDFIAAFVANKSNTQELYTLITQDFLDIAKTITLRYFDVKYSDAVQTMNKVLTLFTTQIATVTLSNALKEDLLGDLDDEDTISTIGAFISLLLDTCESQMVDKTIAMYVDIISETLYPTKITEMSTTLGVSEEAVVDMVIAVPYFGRTMTAAQLNNYAPKFLSVLIDYSDEMINTMTAENQKDWFYMIFPDVNKQSAKAAGRCLTDEVIEFTDEKQKTLYAEYVNMLYMVLHDNDICDINMVLKFIVKELSKRKDLHRTNPIIFSAAYAAECSDNIKKALVDYCTKDNTAKSFFVN